MKITASKDIEILTKLYDVNKGTLKELSEAVGIRLSTGKIYDIKDELLQSGILVADGTKNQRIGLGEKPTTVYKVNHQAIDRLLIRQFSPAAAVYKRIYDGKMQILPRLDKEFWLKEIFKLLTQKIKHRLL